MKQKDINEFQAANAEQDRRRDVEDNFKNKKKEKMLKGGADILVQVKQQKLIKDAQQLDYQHQTIAERKKIEDSVRLAEAKEALAKEDKRRKLRLITEEDRALK